MSLTTDRSNPLLHQTYENGQNKAYLVLSEEELAMGFVRPVRKSYVHIGQKIERDDEGRIIGRLIRIDDPEYDSRDYYTKENGYAGYIVYPKDYHRHVIGRYLTKEEVDAIVERKTHFGGCGGSTTMSQKIAETFAAEPSYYTETYCVHCGKHLPVGQFIWDDGEVLGT